MSHSVLHPRGGYRYLPGIFPYSCGVVASDGYEIVHVTLKSQRPWAEGMKLAREFVIADGLSEQNLCGFELRCPKPHPMDGFIQFNRGYRELLEQWDVLVDGENPVARTNVAPVNNPPSQTDLFAFSYARPSSQPNATFVIAGGGELVGSLAVENIIRAGEISDSAMVEKAQCVIGLMQERLDGLGVDQSGLTAIDVYTEHHLKPLLDEVLLQRLPITQRIGVRWFYTRPPVEQIEFEMDMRGTVTELLID
ncbi:MAG TPA: hypothetical protein DCP67_10180 [Planctomycetaceae bacterium]|nr:hypothetical protein [Pirellulales bacterium]HAL14169.1 hypothetical protein [Planctomycetaceae bacterium]HCK70905.1 hypothetical protein [Planctomycetaceae bacterium]